jgi:hypothetical protein
VFSATGYAWAIVPVYTIINFFSHCNLLYLSPASGHVRDSALAESATSVHSSPSCGGIWIDQTVSSSACSHIPVTSRPLQNGWQSF